VFSFTPRPLYLWGKKHLIGEGGFQCRSGFYMENFWLFLKTIHKSAAVQSYYSKLFWQQ
jgi:hypothetical protein